MLNYQRVSSFHVVCTLEVSKIEAFLKTEHISLYFADSCFLLAKDCIPNISKHMVCTYFFKVYHRVNYFSLSFFSFKIILLVDPFSYTPKYHIFGGIPKEAVQMVGPMQSWVLRLRTTMNMGTCLDQQKATQKTPTPTKQRKAVPQHIALSCMLWSFS